MVRMAAGFLERTNKTIVPGRGRLRFGPRGQSGFGALFPRQLPVLAGTAAERDVALLKILLATDLDSVAGLAT
jgi:hypothetical protein